MLKSAPRGNQQLSQDRCCSEDGREVRDQEDGPVLRLHDRHESIKTGPDVGKSSCFLSLGIGRNRADWERDFWHMVQHMRGDRHLTLCWRPKTAAKKAHEYGESQTWLFDPVGCSVKKISVMDSYEPLTKDEALQYEQLLRNAYHGNLQEVEASFDKVKQLRDPKLNPLQPIGTIAAVRGHLPILEFVLSKGAIMDRELALAIKQGADRDTGIKNLYEKDSKRLNDIINPPLPADFVPNVPDEWKRRWDEICPH